MATVQELFAKAAKNLVANDERVQIGKIFHSEGIKSDGKFFAFNRKEEIVVKLPHERVTQLIAKGSGWPFDAGKGRPMREWVILRPASLRACNNYLAEALEFMTRKK